MKHGGLSYANRRVNMAAAVFFKIPPKFCLNCGILEGGTVHYSKDANDTSVVSVSAMQPCTRSFIIIPLPPNQNL